MTKFVLNSGGINTFPDKRPLFHREIVKGLGKEPQFLLCNFAQPREVWEEKYPNYCAQIAQDLPKGMLPNFKLAMPDTFEQDCREADVIYLHGGDDHLLLYWLKKFDLAKIWKDKVVATNSASSDALSTSFWTCDWRMLMDGLAILPIKFIPHFNSTYGANDPRGPIDWQAAQEELSAYGNTTLPVHALEEGDFVVINQ